MPSELLTERDGAVLLLTISGSETRNTLSAQVLAAGIEALNGAENSAEIRSVVIVGEGSWFCAGGSLQRLLGNRDREPSVQAESVDGPHPRIDSIPHVPKPPIAPVEAPAPGAAFPLAPACPC